MRNFFPYLELFKKQNHNCIDFCDGELHIPPRVKTPTTKQENVVVSNFFSGKNVCYEDISIQDEFNYRATVVSNETCSEEEFACGISAGLKELGVNAKTLVQKRKSGTRNSNFLVTISLN